MTSIGSVSNLSYATILANAQRHAQANTNGGTTTSTTTTSDSATTVTLSATAKAALADKDFTTVTSDSRATLDSLLSAAKLTDPLDDDGNVAVDLSKVDRRELYAMASNGGGKFTSDEQSAAALEIERRFDAAMAGPTAVARVTGAIKGLYTSAMSYLDSVGPEEKSSTTWQAQKAALQSGLDQLADDPTQLPADNADDPVLSYLDRLTAGETTTDRDVSDVASDARTALDQQYLSAAGAGTKLVFNNYSSNGQRVDFSSFDSRSLSAIALNTDSKFSDAESRAAKSELRSRTGATILAGLSSANSASDPGAFAQNLISAYGSMSDEERQATGWTPEFYSALVANYQSSVKIASMFSDVSASLSASGSSSSSSSSSSGSMSLLDYMN